jgi:hypothetical protein
MHPEAARCLPQMPTVLPQDMKDESSLEFMDGILIEHPLASHFGRKVTKAAVD